MVANSINGSVLSLLQSVVRANSWAFFFLFFPFSLFLSFFFWQKKKERKKERAFDVFCRWSEVTRKVELWVQILELNENGEYCPVEVTPARDVCTGGIFQLRQVRWHVQDFSCE